MRGEDIPQEGLFSYLRVIPQTWRKVLNLVAGSVKSHLCCRANIVLGAPSR